MFVMTQKLKVLEETLKSWNKNEFGDVHSNVKASMTALDQIQDQINSSGDNDELFAQKKRLKLGCSLI